MSKAPQDLVDSVMDGSMGCMLARLPFGGIVQTGTPRERRNTSTWGAIPLMAPLRMPTTETARPPGILGIGTLPSLGLYEAGLGQLPGCSHPRDLRRSGWCAQTFG